MYRYACTYLGPRLGSGLLGVLDEVLEGQSCLQHHGLLTWQHLVVYGVVEMGDLRGRRGGEEGRGGKGRRGREGREEGKGGGEGKSRGKRRRKRNKGEKEKS